MSDDTVVTGEAAQSGEPAAAGGEGTAWGAAGADSVGAGEKGGGTSGGSSSGGGPPRKLYKIGEVMQYSGISRQTLHNYTVLGLITEEERTPSGHRLYGEDVFARLELIGRLKQSLSLREVREHLDRRGEGEE